VQTPGTKLAQLRGPTYVEIADRAGSSVSLVRKVMRGERRPNASIRKAVEDLCAVPAWTVFGDVVARPRRRPSDV
jgi:transcriptional regulator with XRE-family HTH domain